MSNPPDSDELQSLPGRPATEHASYARRLFKAETKTWRRWIDVQAPYRWNIRRLKLGFTLDVGAGIGRNLGHLNGNGVGVDHNAEGVRIMRERGFTAYLPADFYASEFAVDGRFDSLLLSHVLEHLSGDGPLRILQEYLRFVRPGGKVVVITPQQKGFSIDPTHMLYIDVGAASALLRQLGLSIERAYSFPLPSFVGPFLAHNEFVVVGTKAP